MFACLAFICSIPLVFNFIFITIELLVTCMPFIQTVIQIDFMFMISFCIVASYMYVAPFEMEPLIE